MLHHCILRAHDQVFVVSHWSNVASLHARASGRQNDVRGRGRHRVSSSRGAELHFGVVVVFVCFICGCIFRAPFLSFEWVVFLVCCKRHVLPLACIFSTDFLGKSIFSVASFSRAFSNFSFTKSSCVVQRHVLPLGCIFFNWFLTTVVCTVRLFHWANFGFEWYRLWYEVRNLGGGKG